MFKRIKSLTWIVSLFIALAIIACSDEVDSIVTTNETLSSSDIVGTWVLTHISYDSSGNTITLTPGVGIYSHTLKFWENKQGQIISFNSGGAKVQEIRWRIQGNVIILISDDNIMEYIRCEFIDPCLYMEYAFTTLAGDQVLAVYEFAKEE
jgi:hypothetical protein